MSSLYRSAVLKGGILIGAPVLVLIFFSPQIMEMFGEGFGEGASVLRTLLAFGLLLILIGPAHQLLLMVGKTRSMAVISGVSCTLIAAAGLLIVPAHGAFAFSILKCSLLEGGIKN